MTYFESVAGQNAVEHIANAIGEIAARMQQQNEILLRIEQRLKGCDCRHGKYPSAYHGGQYPCFG